MPYTTKSTPSSEVTASHHWRTPMYYINRSLSNDLVNDIDVDIPEKVTVTVPNFGLYGFIFGTNEHRENLVSVSPELKKRKKGNDDLTKHCGCAFKAVFSVVGHGRNPSNHIESIKLPLEFPTSSRNFLTSTRVGKTFYLPKGTKVHIECLASCENSDSCEWCWSVVLQKKYDLHKYESEIPEQPHKKLKKNEDASNSGSKKISESFSYFEVDFDPMQSSKKPLICAKCCRKFPNCHGIRNHCITQHAPKIGESCNECDDDYSDLIGPKIFRTRLTAAYEDEDIVVVVKPQGLPVHGSKWTLPKSDLLLEFRSKLNRAGDFSKPRMAHRLDGATGGLLVVAKSTEAERNVKKHFENRLCRKRYRAIVFGKLVQNQHEYSSVEDGIDGGNDEYYSDLGIINVALGGKVSITRYRVVKHTKCNHPKAGGFVTTIDLFPVTGRRHQLRRHLELIGHPIWGDIRYGPYSKTEKIMMKEGEENLECHNKNDLHSRMCLWALEISFPHPCKEEIVHASIDEPLWYEKLRNSI